MAPKIILFEQQARDKILKGVNIMADAVKSTLGPKGRNAILEKSWGAPNVTKDGVTVAKEIELEDKFENLGAQMLKEVASKTSDVAGDGTPQLQFSPRQSTVKASGWLPQVRRPWTSSEGLTPRLKPL